MDAYLFLILLALLGFLTQAVLVLLNALFFLPRNPYRSEQQSLSVHRKKIVMKQIDMKHLRKSAALLPLVALPVVAMPAYAQERSWEEEDTTIYSVVINHEEQYSIWFADRELPEGWKNVGVTGTNKECLAYIEEVWTDMRPLSLRKRIAENKDLAKGEKPYQVVINHEQQYAVWLAGQKMTDQWRDTGETCSLQDCMAYIEEVWTDMRPLSLRKKMEEDTRKKQDGQ